MSDAVRFRRRVWQAAPPTPPAPAETVAEVISIMAKFGGRTGDLSLLLLNEGDLPGDPPLSQAVAEAWPRLRYVELGAQICREVADAHSRGEIMGAIRPDLITLNLADYPVIARGELERGSAYCAPECRVTGQEPSSPNISSDVYAVGGVLFFMLLERDPPLLATRVALREETSQLPSGLATILGRCLAPSERRYASVEDIEHDLMEWGLNDQTTGNSPPWDNPFLAGPESSGARPALRSTIPPAGELINNLAELAEQDAAVAEEGAPVNPHEEVSEQVSAVALEDDDALSEELDTPTGRGTAGVSWNAASAAFTSALQSIPAVPDKGNPTRLVAVLVTLAAVAAAASVWL